MVMEEDLLLTSLCGYSLTRRMKGDGKQEETSYSGAYVSEVFAPEDARRTDDCQREEGIVSYETYATMFLHKSQSNFEAAGRDPLEVPDSM